MAALAVTTTPASTARTADTACWGFRAAHICTTIGALYFDDETKDNKPNEKQHIKLLMAEELTRKFSSPSRLTLSRADSSMPLFSPSHTSGYMFRDSLVLPWSSEVCPPPKFRIQPSNQHCTFVIQIEGNALQ